MIRAAGFVAGAAIAAGLLWFAARCVDAWIDLERSDP